jgi:Leucine-rich repeat (LRR) protein
LTKSSDKGDNEKKKRDCLAASVIQGLEHIRILRLTNCTLHGPLDVFPNKLSALDIDTSRGLWCKAHANLVKAMGTLVSLRWLGIRVDGQTFPCRFFEQMGALEALTIHDCDELIELPFSIGQLRRLRELRIYSCAKLRALPEALGQLRALHILKVYGCKSLKVLPDSIGQLGALRRLQLDDCESLQSLPGSFWGLVALEELFIEGCPCVDEIADSAGKLPALRHLKISFPSARTGLFLSRQVLTLECLVIWEPLGLHKSPHGRYLLETRHLSGLKFLTISRPAWTFLHASLGQLVALESLVISDCPGLTRLPESLGQLTALRRLAILGCGSLEALPEFVERFPALEKLLVGICESLKVPQSL